MQERGILVADGAWGTELAERGLSGGQAPELWNLKQPETVLDLSQRYVDSGSDIILSNTFGGSRIKLQKSQIADRTIEINRLGIELSRRAADGADRPVLVFASVGPTGELLQPLGERTENELADCFAEQIGACVDAGADGVVLESMIDLGELRIALKAARDCGSPTVVACMTFEKGKRGYATLMGVTPEHASSALQDAGADIIGSNCGSGMADLIAVAALMRRSTNRPLWIKPNAGLPQLVGGQTVYSETPEQMASHLGDLLESGANIVGGCCGTTPRHVRLMADAAARHRSRARELMQNVVLE